LANKDIVIVAIYRRVVQRTTCSTCQRCRSVPSFFSDCQNCQLLPRFVNCAFTTCVIYRVRQKKV